MHGKKGPTGWSGWLWLVQRLSAQTSKEHGAGRNTKKVKLLHITRGSLAHHLGAGKPNWDICWEIICLLLWTCDQDDTRGRLRVVLLFTLHWGETDSVTDLKYATAPLSIMWKPIKQQADATFPIMSLVTKKTDNKLQSCGCKSCIFLHAPLVPAQTFCSHLILEPV